MLTQSVCWVNLRAMGMKASAGAARATRVVAKNFMVWGRGMCCLGDRRRMSEWDEMKKEATCILPCVA